MRWGLVGTRGLASFGAAPAIAESELGKLTAVLGSDASGVRAFADEHGAKAATTSLEEFLAVPGMEAVWVASPTFLHREQGLAALRAGKHLLMEKPLAIDAEGAWELVHAAREAGRVLATGYQARYVTGHRRMAELIREGAIGAPTVARTYYGIHRSGPPPEWRRHRDSARWGALADVGTHHVDLVRMLLGEVSDVTALWGAQLGFETDDVVAAALRLESGLLATLTATTNVWTQSTRIEVHGTAGALVAVDTSPKGEGTVTLYRPEHEPEDVTGQRVAPWAAQVDAVTRAALGEPVAYATGEDGARNVEILERLVP